jgi:hypothetical protein
LGRGGEGAGLQDSEGGLGVFWAIKKYIVTKYLNTWTTEKAMKILRLHFFLKMHEVELPVICKVTMRT